MAAGTQHNVIHSLAFSPMAGRLSVMVVVVVVLNILFVKVASCLEFCCHTALWFVGCLFIALFCFLTLPYNGIACHDAK